MLAAAAALVAAAAAILFGAPLSDPLWYDELQSVTFAAHGPAATLRAVAGLDAHPPLYYLQLGVWIHAGTSDAWLRLNGVLWFSLVGAGSWLGFERSRPLTRVLATLGAILAPASLYYATEVRMYPMVVGLTTLLWGVASVRVGRSKGATGVAALLALCLVYAHAIGVLAAVAALLGAAAQRLSPGRWWRSTAERVRDARLEEKGSPGSSAALVSPDSGSGRIIGLLLFTGVVALPWLLGDHVAVDHAASADRARVWRDLALLAGGFGQSAAWGWAALVLGLVLPLVGRDSTRFWGVVAMVGVPVGALVVVGTVRPVWHGRALLFAVPVWTALCVAAATEVRVPRARAAARRGVWVSGFGVGVGVALVAALVFGALSQRQGHARQASVVHAVAFIEEHGTVDDAVLVPNARLFWGWSWYAGSAADPLAGPDGYVPASERLPQAGVGPGRMSGVPEGGTVWSVTKSSDRAARTLAADPAWERAWTLDRLTVWRERR